MFLFSVQEMLSTQMIGAYALGFFTGIFVIILPLIYVNTFRRRPPPRYL